MSKIVHSTGSMRLIGKTDQDHTLNYVRNTLTQLGENPNLIPNVFRYLTEEYSNYVLIGMFLFKIENIQDHDADASHFKMTTDNDGVFYFDVKYYNGGYSLSEAIEHALKEMK